MYFLISFENKDKPKDLMVSGTFPQIFEATKAMVCLPRFVRTDGKYRFCLERYLVLGNYGFH